MREGRIQITIIKAGHHRHLNVVSLAGQWWPNIKFWLGSFVIFHGIRNSIDKGLYSIVIFQEGSRPPVLPLDPRMMLREINTYQQCMFLLVD